MPINPATLTNILAAAAIGRVAVCEYLKVTWSDAPLIKYYSTAAWQDEAPFTAIGLTIEPRLIPQNKKDPFHELEINPDLRTESITVTFDDIDKDITTKFQTYGSGVTCEFFLYYPGENVHVSIWSGQLQAPTVYGWKTVKAVATNGYRSRELFIPSRKRPRECTANVFGGLLPDADAIRSSLCPYDRHIGGSVGNWKTTSPDVPYAGCPKTRDACVARLGNNGLYFGGFNTNARSMVTNNQGWLAVSRGHASNNKESIRVIFGTKTVKGLPLLLWAPQSGSTLSQSYIRGVWEVGEGPVDQIRDFRANGTLIGTQHINWNLGTRGQPRTSYTSDVSNFSSTAHLFAVSYWFDITSITEFDPTSISTEVEVRGFSEVCVYTNPSTKTRIWSDNRVFCLLELYKNQKFGLGYIESKFELADWITAATWSDVVVSHTITDADGAATVNISRRSTFNAILEGRAVGEQIEDICRAGGISVPFEYEGKFTVTPFRAATAGELSAARVFYDKGSSVNIIWEGGQPLIELSQIPNNKIPNEIEVRFEEASNNGTERPITVDDPNQKLLAGRQQGPDYFLSVPKKFSAFGITSLAEALRFAYRLLKFGEFDEGGTDNNLRLKLTVPFEYVLDVKRYSIIKVVSELLTPFTLGSGSLTDAPEYFRVLRIKKLSNGRAEITAQAYNQTAYEAFEVDSGSTVSSHPCAVYNAGSFELDGLYEYDGENNGKPAYAFGQNYIYWDGADWQMQGSDTLSYYEGAGGDFPWDATWTATVNGLLPVPFVTQGIATRGGGGEILTIGTPTYSTATGVLSVTIN